MDSNGAFIQFQGPCDIRTAGERQGRLIGAFRASGDVQIDCARAEDVDLTLVQQLIAATRTARAANKAIRLVAVSDSLRNAFARAGVRLSPADNSIVTP